MSLRVESKRMLAYGVCEISMASPDGTALPNHTVGAHVAVETPTGKVRCYSLTNDPDDHRRYVIAVAVTDQGSGASLSLAEHTRVGDTLAVSEPVNRFALVPADRYVFIAGGIGITPIRAMRRHVRRWTTAEARLIYLFRDSAHAPYLDELIDDRGVLVHESQTSRLDLWPFLAEPDDEARVYCCGSIGLMNAVRAMTMHWRPSRVHFESFVTDPRADGDRPFDVVWKPTGQRIQVSATESLLDALQRNGVAVSSSCRSGTCGSCEVRVTAGIPDHRDQFLDDERRERHLTPCVSRAMGELEIEPIRANASDTAEARRFQTPPVRR